MNFQLFKFTLMLTFTWSTFRLYIERVAKLDHCTDLNRRGDAHLRVSDLARAGALQSSRLVHNNHRFFSLCRRYQLIQNTDREQEV